MNQLTGKISYNVDGFKLQVEINISSSGVTALFGPSGCGKTSLLRVIAGLEKEATGTLSFGEETWLDSQLDTYRPSHERSIGMVFQKTTLFPHLTVEENLKFSFKRAKEPKFKFDKVVELIGLKHLLDRGVQKLSGGEKQRVALGRAILSSPKLLLLDEPMAGLDSESKAELLPFLEKVARDLHLPIIYVSHSQMEVARLADHIILMEAGRIVGSGKLSQVLTDLEQPLSRKSSAISVIEARVKAHDDKYSLTELEIEGSLMTVSKKEITVGSPVRIAINAKDVSLTLERSGSSSILNILKVSVLKIKELNESQVLVELDGGGFTILARITKKSKDRLNLSIGKSLFAQIKSVGIL